MEMSSDNGHFRKLDDIHDEVRDVKTSVITSLDKVSEKLTLVADALEDNARAQRLYIEHNKDKIPMKLVVLMLLIVVIGFTGTNGLSALLRTIDRTNISEASAK